MPSDRWHRPSTPLMWTISPPRFLTPLSPTHSPRQTSSQAGIRTLPIADLRPSRARRVTARRCTSPHSTDRRCHYSGEVRLKIVHLLRVMNEPLSKVLASKSEGMLRTRDTPSRSTVKSLRFYPRRVIRWQNKPISPTLTIQSP